MTDYQTQPYVTHQTTLSCILPKSLYTSNPLPNYLEARKHSHDPKAGEKQICSREPSANLFIYHNSKTIRNSNTSSSQVIRLSFHSS